MANIAGFQAFLRDIRPFLYRKSITYVDVGAYFGETFNAVVASGIKVREAHLVEPNPISRNNLEKNIENVFRGNILEIHPVALGAEKGSVKIRPAKGMTKVVADSQDYKELGVDVVDVPCLTLSELSLTFNVRHIAILKVDVEGFELNVLRGAENILAAQGVDIIYLEVGFNPDGTQQVYYRDVEDFLNPFGYRVFKIYEQTHELHSDMPFLRRANVAFFSSRFADSSPYKLSLELFEAKKELKKLAAQLEARESELGVANNSFTQQAIKLQLVSSERDDFERQLCSQTEALESARAELLVAKKKIGKLVRHEKRLKQGFRYRLGELIISSSKSPKGWMSAPVRLAKLFLAYRRREKESAKALLPSSVSSAKKKSITKDVIIITNLRFPGGNASSTLEEVRVFLRAGHSVALVHCPVALGQKAPISERYAEYAEHIYDVRDLQSLIGKLVIVRHPRVACSPLFLNIAKNVFSDRVAFVVNNSIFRPSGDLVYSPEDFLKSFELVACGDKLIYPLGPAIRAELFDGGVFDRALMANYDWLPTFDSNRFEFQPKDSIDYPVSIGRHGRDGMEKWVEDPALLASVYPDSSSFVIKVLGGADNAFKILGKVPANWEVLPFGHVDPARYLSELDVFVYFPNSALNEAFGRTIMEAIFSGVPCVLPIRFEDTFGKLAFYCEPDQVEDVVRRLVQPDERRVAFLKFARDSAVSIFDSSVLLARAGLDGRRPGSGEGEDLSLPSELSSYKEWVQSGAGN